MANENRRGSETLKGGYEVGQKQQDMDFSFRDTQLMGAIPVTEPPLSSDNTAVRLRGDTSGP